MEKSRKQLYHILQCQSLAEYTIVNDWVKAEGWNCSNDCLDQLFKLDPNGFFIGLLYNSAALSYDIITSCTGVKYPDDSLGYIGFYIVRNQQRGQGYGLPIFKKAMEYLQSCKSVGLDAIPAAEPLYISSGFKTVGVIRRMRYTISKDLIAAIKASITDTSYTVKDYTDGIFSKIAEYDKDTICIDRSSHLSYWMNNNAETITKFVQDSQGKIVGYCVLKKGLISGWKIVPLMADDLNIANILFKTAIECLPEDQPIHLDIPDNNSGAYSHFGKKITGEEIGQLVWMFTNGLPTGMKIEKLYGRTSDNFGC